VAFTQPGGGSGSKNLFPDFGTLSGEPMQRSDANAQLLNCREIFHALGFKIISCPAGSYVAED